MKRLIILVLIAATLSAKSQNLGIGDKVPDLIFAETILPGNREMIVNNLSLSNFKGKFIILDFWATWCGPCISSFSKLEMLQKKYQKDLQVIAITHEKLKRIQSFSINRPVDLMLVIDTAEMLRKYFEYRSIPHLVVIDKNGIVKAITHSEEIDQSMIEILLAGKPLKVSLKKDDTSFDMQADYFKADSTVTESFSLQPGIPGVGSFSKVGTGIFKGRRLSMHNFTIDGFYRSAYNLSYYRTAYAIDKKEFEYSNPKNRYCLDVIVPRANDNLYITMQKKLAEHFDIKARWEKRKMMVMVLKRNQQPLHLIASTQSNEYYGASSNHFSGDGVKVSALAEFLENFGLAGMPVIDDSGIEGRFDIHLEWEPEKKGSLKEAFAKAGFDLIKEEREIEVLLLYREE